MQTLKPAYFREDAARQQNPIGRADLAGALDLAYRIRSKYVHELEAIPKALVYVHDHGECARVDREIALTVQGLARLTRTLILQFVQDGPKVATEDYPYNRDIPGILQMELAPQYWGWKHEGFEPKQARLKLSGFLDLYASVLSDAPGSQLVDIRDLLEKYETLIPNAEPAHRLSMLALYYLFNSSVAESQRREGWWDVIKGFASILDAPSMESLSLLLVLRRPIDWTAKMLKEVREQYYRQRYREFGLRLPWLLEAALDLVLAEAHRREGDENAARAVIACARDNHPTMTRLAVFEDQLLTPLVPIDWAAALLGREEPAAAETPLSNERSPNEAVREVAPTNDEA